jgi:ABC-type dipeptide/oligopeptide/nickel transport system ATPase component
MVNLLDLDKAQMKLVRQEISMIFQDPINSLNPRMSVRHHRRADGDPRQVRA